MEEWTTKRINQLGRVVTGKTPPKVNPEYFDGLELFVSPKDLGFDHTYVYETKTAITEKALDRFKNQVLPRDAVMFTSLSYGFGKVGIASKDCLTNQQINSIIVNDEHDFRFVYYLLRVYKPFIFAFNSGIDTPIVPKSVFERIEVFTPRRELQRKIAAVLVAYDDLLDLNRRRIGLLEKIAEQIYREWFVRLRFPGHEDTKILKGVPVGWTDPLIDDAFEFTGGGTPSKKEPSYWNDGDVNWYTPSDITGSAGTFMSQSEDKCTEESVSRSSARMFPPYSVMMTSRATIGAIGINTTPACTNQGFITCIPNKQYPLTFLYHWLKLAKPHFELLAGGATFPELTKSTFKKMRIVTPPTSLVERHEALVRPIFDSIEVLIKTNEQLTDTRDTLLRKLISGKLAVDDLEIRYPPSIAVEIEDQMSRELAHA